MGILAAQGLAKRYGRRQVVKDVSLQVESGEIVGLLGPNGAGKTTSFYMITGLVPLDAGQIMLNDRDLTELPIHLRARLGLGYLPQEASIFRRLTVAENVLAILETREEYSAEERLEYATGLLEELNVSHLWSSRGDSLSGGERRRVEIRRALAASPRFMLLDEPFAGVDPIAVGDIKSIIRHLSERGIGVLITDHHVLETLDVCDRAYIVNNGEIIKTGSPQDIAADQQVRDVYLGKEFKL